MGNLLGAKNLGQHMEAYGMSHSEECFQNSIGELVCLWKIEGQDKTLQC